MLTLLSEVAGERPLLCVVDDAQWLDRASAQVLAFAARRLLAEPVGLVFAAREPGEAVRGLPDLEVRGLPDKDARALLASAVRVRLDEQVWDRIVAETNGNPLALLELPRGLSPAQLAGGFGPVGAQAVPARIEQGFRERLEALPGDTRSLMLIAAAESTGDAGVDVACGRAARDRGFGGGGGPGGRVAGDRSAGAVPASAGALGGVLIGVACGAAGGAPGAGRGDRSRPRSGSAGVASGGGGAGAR